MSTEDLPSSRPTRNSSPAAEHVPSSAIPTLDDILNERSRPPHTLSAFTAFLSHQHCLETLEFTMDAKDYQAKHGQVMADLVGASPSYADAEVLQLHQDWTRLLDIYIKPGSPREINLPAEERDDLLDQEHLVHPPEPETLDAALHRINDLMADSIFLPFLNSVGSQVQARPCGTSGRDSGCCGPDRSQLSKSMYEDRGALLDRLDPHMSRRRPSQPSSTNIEFLPFEFPPSLQSRQGQSWKLTSALSRTSASGISTQVSNSSAASGPDSYPIDDCGGGDSPEAGGSDLMTPPTTPPGSDLATGSSPRRHSPRPNRSDGVGWRKMGMKLWGKKKVHGA